MDLDEPSDDDGERGRVLPEGPLVAGNEEKEERGVATATYFRRYRQMRPFGFKWARAGCEWIMERRTDYNVGWLSGYARRRASFLRDPEMRVGEIHLYLGETWIYEGGSA